MAQDKSEAERKARKIVQEQDYERLDLRAFPYGFVMHRNRLSRMMEEENI